MKLYIITSRNYNGMSDQIIKVFSTKTHLDQWMEYARLMDRELFGDQVRDITQNYKINEAELDNLDFVELYVNAKNLGAQIKPSQQQ